MSYNTGIAIVVCIVLALVSVAWNRYFMSYLRKNGNTVDEKRNSVFSVIRSGIMKKHLLAMNAVLLHNTDDDISQALEYIRPTEHINNLLEMLNNEQRGI